MKNTYLLVLLCSLLTAQTAWADNEVVFSETFAGCDGIGGADGEFDGTKVKAGNLVTDVEGWTFENGSGVEYTRTDVFIEKACEWLEDHIYEYLKMNRTWNEPDYDSKLIEDFRNYIKRE